MYQGWGTRGRGLAYSRGQGSVRKTLARSTSFCSNNWVVEAWLCISSRVWQSCRVSYLFFHQLRLSTEHTHASQEQCSTSVNLTQFTHFLPKLGYSEVKWVILTPTPTGWDLPFFTMVIWIHASSLEWGAGCSRPIPWKHPDGSAARRQRGPTAARLDL